MGSSGINAGVTLAMAGEHPRSGCLTMSICPQRTSSTRSQTSDQTWCTRQSETAPMKTTIQHLQHMVSLFLHITLHHLQACGAVGERLMLDQNQGGLHMEFA